MLPSKRTPAVVEFVGGMLLLVAMLGLGFAGVMMLYWLVEQARQLPISP